MVSRQLQCFVHSHGITHLWDDPSSTLLRSLQRNAVPSVCLCGCITGTAEPDHSPGSNDRNYHPYAEFYAFLYYVFHFVSLGDALEQCDPYGRLLNARPCVCDHGFDTIPGYVLYNRIIIHPGAVTEHKSVAL